MSEPIDLDKARKVKQLEEMFKRQQEMENIFSDLGIMNDTEMQEIIKTSQANFGMTPELEYVHAVLETLEGGPSESKDSDDSTT